MASARSVEYSPRDKACSTIRRYAACLVWGQTQGVDSLSDPACAALTIHGRRRRDAASSSGREVRGRHRTPPGFINHQSVLPVWSQEIICSQTLSSIMGQANHHQWGTWTSSHRCGHAVNRPNGKNSRRDAHPWAESAGGRCLRMKSGRGGYCSDQLRDHRRRRDGSRGAGSHVTGWHSPTP